MRAALWLMGLFAAAVALALFTGDNDGTVTIFWPPHRVDLSVNLVLLLLVGLFVLLHLALRALTAALELPRQARVLIAFGKQRHIEPEPGQMILVQRVDHKHRRRDQQQQRERYGDEAYYKFFSHYAS